MAYGDGGLKSHEVALIKAWYFADPNIPAVWKYGNANAGTGVAAIAAHAGRSPYEVLTGLNARARRIHVAARAVSDVGAAA